METMPAQEFAQLPAEKASEVAVRERSEFLEDLLGDLGSLSDSYAVAGDDEGFARTRSMVKSAEDELAALREGYEVWAAWLDDKVQKDDGEYAKTESR